MTSPFLEYLIVVSLLAATSIVQAHAPSEHAKPTQQLDCTALQESADSTRDEADPVARAIRKQCGTKDVHEHQEVSAPPSRDLEKTNKEQRAATVHQHRGQ